MSDSKQTKCPHCGSSFRISNDQLAAKGGSVRCGSCLQVFRADQHLVGSPAPAPSPAPQSTPKTKAAAGDESWALDLIGEKAAPAKPAAPVISSAGGDDEFGFSDDDISDFMSDDHATIEAPRSKTLLFDDEINEMLDDIEPPHQADATNHHSNENADESWAKDILSELEHEEKQKDSKKYGMEILDGKTKAAPKNAKLAAALGMGSRIADEPAPKTNKAASKHHDSLSSSDDDILGFLNDDDLSSGISPPPPLNNNPFGLPEQPLANLNTPVTLKPTRAPINWGHLLSWVMLCLVAIAMFIAQYTYFNFETLAVNPIVRPVFEQACQQIGCHLPDIPDPSKLHIDDVIVRKHPTAPDALVVDAILRNDATFPQTFPALRLRFSNAADEVIASRILRPSEYLMGEAKLLRRIPPNTPIRLSLEIVDPGQEAMSYGIDPLY